MEYLEKSFYWNISEDFIAGHAIAPDGTALYLTQHYLVYNGGYLVGKWERKEMYAVVYYRSI